MSGKVVKLTSFFLILGILLLGVQIYRYYDSTKETRKKEIQEIEKKLESTKKKIEEMEKKKQSLEEEKAWKIEVYKTWEKAVNSLELK